MTVLAIDAGTTHSGVAGYSESDGWMFWPKVENGLILDWLRGWDDDAFDGYIPELIFGTRDVTLLIEQVTAIGATIGNETLRTVEWGGRFYEAWDARGGTAVWVPRQAVKSWHLKGRFKRDEAPKGTDARIRKVMLEKYGKAMKGATSHSMQAAAIVSWFLEIKETP